MVNSGTEATMSAIRLARGFTGRDAIVKFAGCYHGHVDSLLVKAGSGGADAWKPVQPRRSREAAPPTRSCSNSTTCRRLDSDVSSTAAKKSPA